MSNIVETKLSNELLNNITIMIDQVIELFIV